MEVSLSHGLSWSEYQTLPVISLTLNVEDEKMQDDKAVNISLYQIHSNSLLYLIGI